MTISRSKCVRLTVVLACFSPLSVLAQTQGPSLVQLAASEAERRSAIAKSSPAYGNADLKPREIASVPATAGPITSGETQTTNAKAGKTSDRNANEDPRVAIDDRLRFLSSRVGEVLKQENHYMTYCKGHSTTVQPSMPHGIPLDSIVIGGTDALVARGVLLPPGTSAGPFQIANEALPECRSLHDEVEAKATTILRELDEVTESARRNGIQPGVLRDLMVKHGFKP
jgi:hypothetical protein